MTGFRLDEHQKIKRIVVAYVDGSIKVQKGTLLDARELAERSGLISVPTTNGTVQWARGETRKGPCGCKHDLR